MCKLKNVLKRYINKVDIISNKEYFQIGIRSHGKGIFYKEKVTGEELGNKRIFWLKDDLFIVNIVFAWEQAVAKTTINEIGWVASHRFPMYESLNGKIDIDFITYYFKTKKGKHLLGLASPGGAGRNKTLGQTEFENLDLTLPQQVEQQNISILLSLIDERISTQNKIIEQLESSIKGLLNTVSQKDTWELQLLKNLLNERKEQNTNGHTVFSVAVKEGLVDQVKHLGRSFAAKDTSDYNVVKFGDIVYTKSPTGSFPYGIVKQSHVVHPVAVSPLYGVYQPKNIHVANILHNHFSNPINANNYLHSLIQKGAKNTINISSSHFLGKAVLLPTDSTEIEYLSLLLTSMRQKIHLEREVLNQFNNQKCFLLKEMFI